jgi:Raf kinase inhibitor-like YbhB/YbcL family protein
MSSRRPPRRPPIILAVAGIAGLAALLGPGCDTGDGRALDPPPPGATAPPRPTGTTTSTTLAAENPPVGSEQGSSIVLSSVAFAPNGPIPARYTCSGDNVSPPLAWAGVPAGTVELALSVVDHGTGGAPFVHWAVTGLPATLTGIEEGELPEQAVEARNSSTEFGWYGPCPPAGETHSYVITLFALSEPSGVASGTSGADAIARVAVTPGVVGTLTGTFTGT